MIERPPTLPLNPDEQAAQRKSGNHPNEDKDPRDAERRDQDVDDRRFPGRLFDDLNDDGLHSSILTGRVTRPCLQPPLACGRIGHGGDLLE